MGYPSVYWDTMSPTLNRGRKPAVKGDPEQEQQGFWDNLGNVRDYITGQDAHVDRPWYLDMLPGQGTMEQRNENRKRAFDNFSGPLIPFGKWW